jgi:hypothetical protein
MGQIPRRLLRGRLFVFGEAIFMNESHAKINSCLRHFSSFIGSPLLTLNEEGVCNFNYESEFDITLELPDKSTQLYLYSSVMPVPGAGKLELYEKLLKLNVYCLDTRGATLALDPHDSQILLCYQYPLDALEEVVLVNLLTNFVDTLKTLREQLTSYSQTLESSVLESAAPWQYLANSV